MSKMPSDPLNREESSGAAIGNSRLFARPSRPLNPTATSSQLSSSSLSASTARPEPEQGPSSNAASAQAQEPLLYPRGLPFESIADTLLRHLCYYDVYRNNPSPTGVTNDAIFASVRSELLMALTLLTLDMSCGMCENGSFYLACYLVLFACSQ